MKEKILQESMERRDRFTKHFHMEHKGMAAAVYPMPVHYETEDGRYEEIDNRLEYNQLETENNKEVYRNKASDVKVQFAKSAYEEELVGIEKDGNRITWSFVPVQMEQYQRSGSARPVKEFRVLGQEETKDQPEALGDALQEQTAAPSKETGAASLAGADPQTAEARTEMPASERPGTEHGSLAFASSMEEIDGTSALPEAKSGEAEKTGTTPGAEPSPEGSLSPDASPEAPEETREEEIKRLMGVPHLRSEGVYEDILSGLDLHYTIQGDRIKEDITLKTKEAAQIPLTFAISHPGLHLCQRADGSFGLYKDLLEDRQPDENTFVYEFVKPYMYDAAGNLSYEVAFTVASAGDGKSRITITPDASWLLAKDRSYPVVIDPMTETSKTPKNIQETFISSRYSAPVYGNGSFAIGTSDEYGKSRALLRFESLPQISKGSIIYAAKMYLWQYGYSTYGIDKITLAAQAITGNWSESSVRWSSQPATEDETLDYQKVGATGNNIVPIGFDVTRLVRNWYGSGQNLGIRVKSLEEDRTALADRAYATFYSSDYPNLPSDVYPSGMFYYRNVNGLEDYQSYHDQSAGRAGTGHTNDFTGNLVWIHPDADTDGGVMPASVSHVYNSSDADAGTRMGYGWRLSAMEELKDSGIKDYPYVYTDQDGTKHYFYRDKDDSNKLKDEDGLGMEITRISGSDFNANRILKMKDRTQYYFGGDGYLRKIQDLDGNAITYHYSEDTTRGNYLSQIEDGNGRCITFEYEDKGKDSKGNPSKGNLTAIVDPAGRRTTFAYDGYGSLNSITYPDGKKATFFHNEKHLLSAIRNIDNYKVEYTYTTDFQVPRVSQVLERGADNGPGTPSGEPGQVLRISYQNGNVTVFEEPGQDGNIDTASDNKKTTYNFDDTGRPTDVLEDDGFANSYAYYTEGMKNNKLSKEGSTQKTVYGLLKNPCFDRGHWQMAGQGVDGWTSHKLTTGTLDYNVNRVQSVGYAGLDAIRIVKNERASAGGVRQDVQLNKGTYTLSAYVKTAAGFQAGTAAKAGAKIMVIRANGEQIPSEHAINYQTDPKVDEGWERLSLTFDLAATETIRVFGCIYEATGTAWMTGFQLEAGKAANKLNLVNNPGFRKVVGSSLQYLVGWQGSHGTPSIDQMDDRGRCATLRGEIGQRKYLYQSIAISGKEGDVFNLSCWVKGTGVPEKEYAVSAEVIYENNSRKWHHFKCNPHIKGWQFVSGMFSTDDQNVTTENLSYREIKIHLFYGEQPDTNQVYFDGVQLIKDDGDSYVYDDEGNLVSVKSAAEKSGFTSDKDGNLTKMGNIDGTSFESTYDAKNHVTCAKNSEGVRYLFQYDSKGNPIRTIAQGGERFDAAIPGRTYYIREKVSGKYMECRNGGTVKGTIVQLNVFDGTKKQQWKLVDCEDGHFMLVPQHAANLRLDLKDASNTERATIQIHDQNNNDAQRWKLHPKDKGGYQISCKATKDKKGLSNVGGLTNTADGHAIQNCTLGDDFQNQQWYFEPADLPQISDVPEAGKTYSIRVRHSGQYLDVQNFGTAEGARIMTYYYNGGENQQFRLTQDQYTGSNHYYLEAVHAPGMVVTVDGDQNGDHYPSVVLKKRVYGSTQQMFAFKPTGNGTGYLIERYNGRESLDVPYANYAAETSIIATKQPAGGAVPANKHWILEACSDRIVTSMTYTDGGRNVKTVTDALGNVTTNHYDSNDRLLTSVQDANKKYTYYQYDRNTDQVTRVSRTVNGQTVAVDYQYDNDRLKKITHNGFSYTYDYDVYGNQTGVSIGSTKLEQTTYKNRNGLVDKVTYANGMAIQNEYDKEDQLVAQYLVSAAGSRTKLYEVTYDNYGNALVHKDLDAKKTYRYQYDMIGRMLGADTSDGQTLRIAYDKKNRVESVVQKFDSSKVETSYIYGDPEKRQKPGLFYGLKVDGTERVSYAYDSLGRLNKRTLKLGSGKTFETSYACMDSTVPGQTSTTIQSVTNGDQKLSYTYDKLGNIETIFENGIEKVSYQYDELSQLIRENNRWQNLTICYEYDKGGNLTYRKEYAYTIATTPTSLKRQVTYTYGNSVWKDQLTAYDGTSITYDKMGNPLKYRGMTLTWQKDRELKKVVKSGVSTTYTYNNGGIRTSKTTGGKRTDYYLSGSKIVTMKEGADILHFVYDQDGKLVSMRLKGKDYYYIHNSQGDVIGLVDSSGIQVVSYQYDSWGRQISMKDNTPSSVNAGTRNPFRYREYYFDAETGLYYLNTRYYDPETGRFINADDPSVLQAGQEHLMEHNLYAYCLNNPVNLKDEDGELPKWASNLIKIGIGAAAIGIGVAAAALTGGATIPVLVSSLKIAAVSGLAGGAIEAGGSAIKHRISSGSWKGAGKAALKGFADGFSDGFMWGGITAGATTVGLATKGKYINKVGRLKPDKNPGKGYLGVRYQVKKGQGFSTRSYELHPPHKRHSSHNVWHWQRNQWPYNKNTKRWKVTSKKAKHWTLKGKRI